MKANLTHCPAVVCLQTMRGGFGLQRRSPPFLTLPSPRAADGLPCEAACSPSQRLHAVLTSGHRVDAVEFICSASKAQPLNLMKVEAALSHSSSPCAPHHAETRRRISLPFSISLIANIARKRPELNRDKTSSDGAQLSADRAQDQFALHHDFQEFFLEGQASDKKPVQLKLFFSLRLIGHHEYLTDI
jgi:hypothetical protein